MGKPHPLALRERVVAFAEEGNTHRSSAARFRVSIRFVNDMVKLKRETGRLDPKPQGRRGHGKLAPVVGWVRAQIEARPATTLDELRAELEREHGIEVHRSSVGDLLHRLGLSHKKDLRTSEQKRPDVAHAKAIRISHRQPFMRNHPEQLIFIDETSPERCAKNLNHVTLPEIKDFNALHDARCFRYFVKRYNPGHGTRIA